MVHPAMMIPAFKARATAAAPAPAQAKKSRKGRLAVVDQIKDGEA